MLDKRSDTLIDLSRTYPHISPAFSRNFYTEFINSSHGASGQLGSSCLFAMNAVSVVGRCILDLAQATFTASNLLVSLSRRKSNTSIDF